MVTLILRRVLIAIPTLFLVSLFVFALQRALPGDPFLVLAGEERDPEAISRLREIYRMNDPVFVQFFAWLGQVIQGDFGRSLRTGSASMNSASGAGSGPAMASIAALPPSAAARKADVRIVATILGSVACTIWIAFPA